MTVPTASRTSFSRLQASGLLLGAATLGLALPTSAQFSYSFVDTYDEVCGSDDDEEGCAEISAYDASTARIFTINGNGNALRVLQVVGGYSLQDVGTISLDPYGAQPNSVAAHDGVIAVAVEADVKQDEGVVVFLDAQTLSVTGSAPAGALPDMLAFTPDGRFLLVANEGEPSDDYSVDPEGSITLIDMADLSTRTAGFEAYANAGDNELRIFGPGATVAQDLEPEYITVSEDSKTAWVSLQENNALAIVDIDSATVTGVRSLGLKDHSLAENALDASNQDGEADCELALADPEECIRILSYPVSGMYMPDAIASYSVDGTSYVVSANEGDSRDYDGYSEELRVGDEEYVLDAATFPDADWLKEDANLGRLKTTSASGDTDGDGDFDVIHAYGARSFSIWSSEAELIFDSGNDFEMRLKDIQASGQDVWVDSRSDDKGAEPESVTIGTLSDRQVAFIGLERASGIFVYDISEPTAPDYLGYMNTLLAGDVSPEGLVFVADSEYADRGLLIATNELSNTTTTYRVILGSDAGDTSGAPTVSGNLISWQSDDYYQVQDSETFEVYCEGRALGECLVDSGSYHVINLTTGRRYENIMTGGASDTPQVSGNVISWTTPGYWQVQDVSDYSSICEGDDFLSCEVAAGTYHVINLSSGERFENIVVN